MLHFWRLLQKKRLGDCDFSYDALAAYKRAHCGINLTLLHYFMNLGKMVWRFERFVL